MVDPRPSRRPRGSHQHIKCLGRIDASAPCATNLVDSFATLLREYASYQPNRALAQGDSRIDSSNEYVQRAEGLRSRSARSMENFGNREAARCFLPDLHSQAERQQLKYQWIDLRGKERDTSASGDKAARNCARFKGD